MFRSQAKKMLHKGIGRNKNFTRILGITLFLDPHVDENSRSACTDFINAYAPGSRTDIIKMGQNHTFSPFPFNYRTDTGTR